MQLKAYISGSGKTVGIGTEDDLGNRVNVTNVFLGFVQTLSVNAVGGTFVLTIGFSSVTVPYGVLPSNIDGTSGVGTLQALIESIVGAGNVTVVGYNPYKITFLQEQPLISVNTSGLLSTRAADPTTAGSTIEFTTNITSRRGNWTNVSGGYNGYHYETPAAGDSTTESRWVISGLATGNYQILGIWPGGAGFATNATFRVFDGSTFIGSMVVNQTVTSVREVAAFISFQAIGTFYCASGTLNIILTDDANGKVSADSLMIRPVNPSVALKVQPCGVIGNVHTSYEWAGVFDANYWSSAYYKTSDSRDTWDVPCRGLRPGNYLVELSYWNDPSCSISVPVNVKSDGTNYPISVNQTLPPLGGSHNDGTKNVNFYPVGYYNSTTGEGLTMSVSGTNTGVASISAFAITAISYSGLSTTVSSSVQNPGSPSIKINGGSAIPLTMPFYPNDSSRPYVVFFLSNTINPGDTVTYSQPSGAITTTAGVVGAITNLSVVNRSGSSILDPFEPNIPRTLKNGWNVFTPSYNDPCQMYADLMRSCPDFSGNPFLGYPTYNAKAEIISGYGETSYFRNAYPNPANPYGYNCLPEGTYTVKWKGSGTPSLAGDVSLATGTTTVGLVHTRTYTLTKQSGRDDVYITLAISGECTDLHVYPPDVATDGSDFFHPKYLQMLNGAASLRSMAWFHPDQTVINYSDFAAPDQVSLQQQGFWRKTFTITRFDQYNNIDNYAAPGYLPVLATLSQPHGMRSGCTANFVGSPTPMSIPVTGGSNPNVDFDNYSITIHYDSSIMSPYQFVFTPQGTGTMTAPVFNPGTCSFSMKTGDAPENYIDLCNLVGADAWVNTLESMTDTCVTDLFTMVANRLTPGKKCYVELSNEPWNFAAFPFHYYTQLGHQRGTGMIEAYSQNAAHHHTLARAAFVAAGRDPNQIVRLLNAFLNSTGIATPMIVYCQAQGIPIDALALSPYYSVGPEDVPGYDSLYNAMTTDQILDIAEYQNKLMLLSSFSSTTDHRNILDAHGYSSTRIIGYEMGPATAKMGGTDLNQAYHTQGFHQHPRFLNILLDYYRTLQTLGYDLCNLYVIYGVYVGEGSANGTRMYGAYNGWNQPAGKGDGSDGKADNRIEPFRTGVHVSVVGQSVLEWNSVGDISLLANVPSSLVKGTPIIIQTGSFVLTCGLHLSQITGSPLLSQVSQSGLTHYAYASIHWQTRKILNK